MNFTLTAENAKTLMAIRKSNRATRSTVEDRCMERIATAALEGRQECFIHFHLPDGNKAVLEMLGYKLTKAFDSWKISW